MPVIIIDEGPGSAAAPPYPGQVTVQPMVDIMYFKTPPGLAKLAQIIFGIITIAVNSPIWLHIVAWLALFGTFPWFWIYFFQINRKYAVNPPWIVLEFYYTAGALAAYTIMTFVTFITFFYIVSAIFGLFTTVTYGVGTFFLFQEWKEYRTNPTTVPK